MVAHAQRRSSGLLERTICRRSGRPDPQRRVAGAAAEVTDRIRFLLICGGFIQCEVDVQGIRDRGWGVNTSSSEFGQGLMVHLDSFVGVVLV